MIRNLNASGTFSGAKLALLLTSAMLAFSLSACASQKTAANVTSPVQEASKKGFFGFGGKKHAPVDAAQAGIGVNAYLWRASLETLSFMPITSADPWGGVILTDWYANPEKPDERFKTTIYILDTRLRADGLNVNVNKQVLVNGAWTDAEVTAQTSIDVENAILTRARALRFADVK
jgi:hypothetical protein